MKERVFSILLTLCLLIGLLPVTALADGDASVIVVREGDYLEEVPEGRYAENYGTVGTNNGTITINSGTVTYNYGTIDTVETGGSVTYNEYGAVITVNHGNVYGNDGTIDTNDEGGTVEFNRNLIDVNYASVDTNRGKIRANCGTVAVNDNYYGNEVIVYNFGPVELNKGSIDLNGSRDNRTGVVTTNQGSIKDNEGIVTTNEGTIKNNKSTVTTNQGTIKSNEPAGTVTTNKGTVTENYGAVYTNAENGLISRNEGGVVTNSAGAVVLNYGSASVWENSGEVYNYGGTVLANRETGTEYFQITIVNTTTHTTVTSDLHEAYDKLWLGHASTGTVTLAPDPGYEIKAVPDLPTGVTAAKNANGTWTLTVPGGEALTINVPEATVAPFTLTVHNGTGSGEYAEGTSVTITADEPEAGMRFKAWTGADGLTFTSGSAATPTATFTMPAHAVELTATYEEIPVHTVTVHDGSGSGEYAEGESVTIRAYNPAYGEKFKEWAGAEGLSFSSGSAGTVTATFIMPDHPVELTATYEEAETSTYALELPASVTVTPYAEATAVTADVTELMMMTHADGKTPKRLRLIFTGLTLQSDSGETIACKLRKTSSDTPSNQKMFDFTDVGSCDFEIYIPSDTWVSAVPGTYTGTIQYTARWLYSDNSWSGDIETGTIPVTLTIPETVTLSLDAGEGTVEPGSLEVMPGAAVGELPVPTREGWVFIGWFTEPAESDLLAGQGTQVTGETAFNAAATVYAHWRLPGDINGDGKVTNKDVTRLQKYLKGDSVDVMALNLDVNGDGSVNNKDLTRLQRFVKGANVELS